MKLSHWSWEKDLRPRSIVQGEDRCGSKPSGFWVSVDGPDDWEEFCTREEFRGLDEQYRYSVTLSDNANILYLRTPNALLSFTEKFDSSEKWLRNSGIDWPRVASKYQGIIIAPYQWSLRLDGPHWYYTWDVASGCFWDSSAINTIERLT